MNQFQRWIGSLQMAVVLLVVIAGVLAWGTIYEEQYGTEAVKHAVYGAWWFQAVLAFLALNLASAAIDRYPWKKRHIPFVLAHIGIILILIGGIMSGSLGIEGQLVVSEGQTEQYLRLPQQAFALRDPHSDAVELFPTAFEAKAWVSEPDFVKTATLNDRSIQLKVDKYYPDAITDEVLVRDAEEGGPAIELVLTQDMQEETIWLFAHDPVRFGAEWGHSEVLFIEPKSMQAWQDLLSEERVSAAEEGFLRIRFGEDTQAYDVAVPADKSAAVAIEGTDYEIQFKDYFADFAIGEEGVQNRSDEPNNPAISFVLRGAEGADPYLLFALHPDFGAMHGQSFAIPAKIEYQHPVMRQLPPNALVLAYLGENELRAATTDGQGKAAEFGLTEQNQSYQHPQMGFEWMVREVEPQAMMRQEVKNRSNRIKRQALHVVLTEGEHTAERWMTLDDSAQLMLGDKPIMIDYGAALYPLPVSVKLLDFRKIDYPGTEMAADFESDVVLSDPNHADPMFHKISMNQPISYKGFKFFQASFIEGPVETTVLAVRKDPGTPLVYAGYLIVIMGILTLFMAKPKRA